MLKMAFCYFSSLFWYLWSLSELKKQLYKMVMHVGTSNEKGSNGISVG